MTDMSVAIVDDNADNRFLLDAMLSGAYALSLFEDGPSALAGITEAPPSIVLLDISLPGMDGVEVLGHLRRNERTADIPVVAVTAHAMAGDQERFLDLGFDGYISKPIRRAADVIDAISRLLTDA
jgi:CheY-like chemotaxis protein